MDDIAYEEVIDLLRESFPEWWETDVAWLADPDAGGPLVHPALGAVACRIEGAMRAGDKAMATRAANLANLLAASTDGRVDNLVHVSFFENLDGMDRVDLDLIAGHLSPAATEALHAMVPAYQPHARRARPTPGKARVRRKRTWAVRA